MAPTCLHDVRALKAFKSENPTSRSRWVHVIHASPSGASWAASRPLNTFARSDAASDGSPEVATDGAGNWVAVWQSDDTLGGKPVHPVLGLPGGVAKTATEEVRAEARAFAPEAIEFARLLDVDVLWASDRVADFERGFGADGRQLYSLGDMYDALDGADQARVLVGHERERIAGLGGEVFRRLGEYLLERVESAEKA